MILQFLEYTTLPFLNRYFSNITAVLTFFVFVQNPQGCQKLFLLFSAAGFAQFISIPRNYIFQRK